MRRRGQRRWGAVAVLIGVALLGTALAQTDAGGHLGHHPGQPEPVTGMPGPTGSADVAPPRLSDAAPAPQVGAQTGAGCGGMMGCMGGGPRPFYAALLDMPSLTPEARRFIGTEAEWRIGWGSQAISAGHARLQRALAADDPAAVQQAAAGVREGLQLLESGTAALRAIEAGTSPRQFALAWFRDQLSVPTPEAAATAMAVDGGPWGLSWYHLTTMVFLVTFLIGALIIQYARMRRIGGLVERLTPVAPGLAPSLAPTAPSAATTPKAGTPTVAPTVGAPLGGDPASGAIRSVALAPAPAAKRPWSGTLRVAAIFRETPDVKTFRLIDPEGGEIPFIFQPGQFLTFSAEIGGKPVRRSYTIASSPGQRDYVEITVKREEQGTESRYLHDQVMIGDPLQVSGPSGVFTFTGNEAASIVLISGGVGITPMMCVIRHLTDRGFAGDIFFLYGARTPDDFIFREELVYLQKRHANLHVSATIWHPEGTSWTGATGLISKEFIAHTVPDIARRRVHICGPPQMMEAVKAELVELGVASDKIKTEAFGPAMGAAPVPRSTLDLATAPAPPAADDSPAEAPEPNRAAAVPAADSAVPPAATAPDALPTAAARVEFSRSGKTGPLAPDQTVLEAAEAIGVPIDFSCRVGTCGTCIVPLKQGTVTMEVEDGLSPEDKARGIILACQAKSVGNLVIEA